jgi:hypothetical protein
METTFVIEGVTYYFSPLKYSKVHREVDASRMNCGHTFERDCVSKFRKGGEIQNFSRRKKYVIYIRSNICSSQDFQN